MKLNNTAGQVEYMIWGSMKDYYLELLIIENMVNSLFDK